jgi:hypothetical protein
MTNLDIPLDDIIQPVRKYKPNDPYYYEVDNLPIEELESNCVTLNTNIRTIRDTVVAEYPSESTVRALIGTAQYETQNTWAFGTYQMYLEGNLFDPNLDFNTGKVYQQHQIWDESVGYSTGPLFSRFMGKYIDRAGHQGGTGAGQILNEAGTAWTWTAGHILDWFYDKNYITTTFSDIVKLSSKDVNAITRDDSNSVYDAADPDISNPFMTKADLNTYVKPDSAGAANAAPTANSANPFATMGDISRKDETIFNELLPLALNVNVPPSTITWTDVLTQVLVSNAPAGEYRATIHYTLGFGWISSAYDNTTQFYIGFDSNKDSLDNSWFPSTNPLSNICPQYALFLTNKSNSIQAWGYGAHPNHGSSSKPDNVFESPPILRQEWNNSAGIPEHGFWEPYVGYSVPLSGSRPYHPITCSSRSGGMVQDFTLSTSSDICFKAISKTDRWSQPTSVESCRIVLELLSTS